MSYVDKKPCEETVLENRSIQFVMNSDSREVLPEIIKDYPRVVIVSDPPFNVGYHYGSYSDNMPDGEYWKMLRAIFSLAPSVVIHYPEALHRLSIELGIAPERVVSWVYNSNTAKQHRDIAFYHVKPDFTKVRQPYKNTNDKRIQQRIADGHRGGRLYDWWEVNQVKNVSMDKTNHPCQMPVEVMKNIIGILPECMIIDPFAGSGTTGVACKLLGRNFIGIEIDEDYARLAQDRIDSTVVQQSLFSV